MSSNLRIFVPTALQAVFGRLRSRLEAETRMSVTQLVDLNPVIPERISAGETYDVGITNPNYALELIRNGHADAASHHAFGRVPLAVARRIGANNSVRTKVKELKALFREAESVAFTGSGTSGRTYLKVVERLNLVETVIPKSRSMGAGEPVTAVANGEVELAVAPLTTVLSSPGVVPAGVFPEELGTHIDMSIFLRTKTQIGAATVLAFLTASELDQELAEAGITRFELS